MTVDAFDALSQRTVHEAGNVAVHVDQQRDEELLGASEAAGVLGLDKYNPPIKIWRRHRGLTVHDDADNEAALWGQVLEPVVRGRYALQAERHVYVPQRSFRLDGWLRCTPDGLVSELALLPAVTELLSADEAWMLSEINRGVVGGLQVKTCSAWLGDDWIGGPPAKYEVQCRVEMAVVDLPWVDIVCLVGGQKLVGPFRIERDLQLEGVLLERLREFWTLVQDGREPSVDDSDAWRMHVSEKLARQHPVEIAATEEMRELVTSWRERRRARKAAERAEDETKNDILLRLSAAGATKIDAGELGKPGAYRTKSGTWALKMPTFWRDDE